MVSTAAPPDAKTEPQSVLANGGVAVTPQSSACPDQDLFRLALLGFNHNYEIDPDLSEQRGVEMSVPLTTVTLPDAEAVLWTDIDLLRCIFPEGG